MSQAEVETCTQMSETVWRCVEKADPAFPLRWYMLMALTALCTALVLYFQRRMFGRTEDDDLD